MSTAADRFGFAITSAALLLAVSAAPMSPEEEFGVAVVVVGAFFLAAARVSGCLLLFVVEEEGASLPPIGVRGVKRATHADKARSSVDAAAVLTTLSLPEALRTASPLLFAGIFRG